MGEDGCKSWKTSEEMKMTGGTTSSHAKLYCSISVFFFRPEFSINQYCPE
jgi:hypothetical protein